jgi:hypothetical protein
MTAASAMRSAVVTRRVAPSLDWCHWPSRQCGSGSDIAITNIRTLTADEQGMGQLARCGADLPADTSITTETIQRDAR